MQKSFRHLAATVLACLISADPSHGAAALAPDSAGAAPRDQAEFLGDSPDLILSASQAWGELGWNVAAHQPGQAGAPLRIGQNAYAKGLGHHASGSIHVLLEGNYAGFDAQVGLQPCGSGGSVIFRAFVDGQPRFDSGVLRATNAPMPIHLNLAGAQELRLEANDAGDGITCDMANWADARLTPAPRAATATSEPPLDVARFARVVTWDPNRLDGARASRIEEFRAEDLFLERDLAPNPAGRYDVPVWTNDLRCIGLQWLNRRALTEVALEFADSAQMPSTNVLRVQGWFGDSAWQGNWKPLVGELQAVGRRLVFRLSPRSGLVQTQKIRWIFPAAGKLSVTGLSAFTRSRWAIAPLLIQADEPPTGAQGALAVGNGEFLTNTATAIAWELDRPLRLSVRYGRPSFLKSDPTVLQFRLPGGACGVSVQDVLANECVYVPALGLFVASDPPKTTLSDYKLKIGTRKTVLQEVRELPDQTLTQAMAKTHHDSQNEGPVLLSLACDLSKFVLERDGSLRFQPAPYAPERWHDTQGEMRVRIDTEASATLTRHLDGGWLPVPVITHNQAGLLWTERAFAAPCDEAGSNPGRWLRHSVCLVEFQAANQRDTAAPAHLSLDFIANSQHKRAAELRPHERGLALFDGRNMFAVVETNAAGPLQLKISGGAFELAGTLAPKQTATCTVRFFGLGTTPEQALARSVGQLRDDVRTYWEAVLAPAMHIATPEPFLNNLIRSSMVRCYIAARQDDDGRRIGPWIAAMSYGPLESEAHSVIRGMDFTGNMDFARRSLEFFVHRYNTNGFLTTGYTTFGTAWHLWTLGEHFQLYLDTGWLRGLAPEITRVGLWITRQIEKTKAAPANAGASLAPPVAGLMPPGVMADWNAFACHFWLNAYYYAALRELGAALSDLAKARHDLHESVLGSPDPQLPAHPGLEPYELSQRVLDAAATNGAFFGEQALALRTNLLRAYQWTQAQAPALPLRNGTWIPFYPSQLHSPGKLADFFPGQDAGRSWCYDVEGGAHQLVPAGVFDPNSPEVARIMDHMEDVQFLADGWFDYPADTNAKDWFNLGGFSKVQPYYTRNAEIYALRDDPKPFLRSYFNTLAAMVNPEVLTFWEHFHHSGAWDKTHETGYFLYQTRTMLVTERGDQLWLAPFLPSYWLKDGLAVAVTNAPTRFGPVTYRIASHLKNGYIEARIEPPTRFLPQALVLRLRHPDGRRIRAVTVDGKNHHDFDTAKDCIRLETATRALVVTVRY